MILSRDLNAIAGTPWLIDKAMNCIIQPGVHVISAAPNSGVVQLVLREIQEGYKEPSTRLITTHPDNRLALVEAVPGDTWLQNVKAKKLDFGDLLDLVPDAAEVIIGPAMARELDAICKREARLGGKLWRQMLGRTADDRCQAVILIAPYNDEAWKSGCSTFITVSAHLDQVAVTAPEKGISAPSKGGYPDLADLAIGNWEMRLKSLNWHVVDLANGQEFGFQTGPDGKDVL